MIKNNHDILIIDQKNNINLNENLNIKIQFLNNYFSKKSITI